VMTTLTVLGPWMGDQTLRFVRAMFDSIALIR
jgi:flagellar biosynthesis protein FliQ